MPHLIWDKDLDEIQGLIDEVRAWAKPLPDVLEKKLVRVEKLLRSVRGELGSDEKWRQLAKRRSSIGRPVDLSKPVDRSFGLEKVVEAVRSAFKGRRMSMVSLLVAALGAALLCAVGYWTLFDVAFKGSGISAVFFGDRGLEGLGIGMKIIYYFVIGLALFLSGLIMFVRGRRRSRAL